MRVLVTGAKGFLGSELTRQAVVAGLDVLVTDQSEDAGSFGASHRCANVLDPASLAPAMKGVDAVIHAAGLAHIFDRSKAAEAPFTAVNETGTLNVAVAAARAGVRHFVLVSSVSVYGGSDSGANEESACRPLGPYAESKWQAEQRASEIARETGMRLTILRLVTLYGEGDPGNIGRLMRLIDRRRFIWIGDGSNRKSLLHREDAARACVSVAEAPGEGIQIFNVSSPPSTVRELVEALANALGRRMPSWRIPAWAARAMGKAAVSITGGRGPFGTLENALEKWLSDDVYDGSRFEKTYGFAPQIDLQEGIRREVEWYHRQGTNRREN